MKRIFLAAALLLALTDASLAQTSGDITVEQAWARATPPGATTGVVYLTLANTGASVDTLVGASTPIAGEASLHTELMDRGVMKMRPVKSIDLEPGATIVLKPGGRHLMLMGLKRPLKKGGHFPLTLQFAHAPAVTVQVEVARVGASMPDMPGMDHQ